MSISAYVFLLLQYKNDNNYIYDETYYPIKEECIYDWSSLEGTCP